MDNMFGLSAILHAPILACRNIEARHKTKLISMVWLEDWPGVLLYYGVDVLAQIQEYYVGIEDYETALCIKECLEISE